MADLLEEEDEGLVAEPKEYSLEKNSELRIESAANADVSVTLLDGSAEIFGAELQKGSKMSISGQKLAVFSWTGCKLLIEGRPSVIYNATETPMASYLNLHHGINARRHEAAAAQEQQQQQQQQQQAAAGAGAAASSSGAGPPVMGPRVVLIGPTDSGKSTLSRMLLNWAVRSGWEPTFVDLDVGQGTITVPGCVSACPVEVPLEVEPQGGISPGLELPLVYYLGHASPGDCPELYKFLIDRLAAILERRASASPRACASGMVINTMGWVEGLGYELQLHAITALKADIIVVLEQDRLYSQLVNEFKSRPSVKVLKLDKSGGVVKRERDERRTARDGRVREYFYGNPVGSLQPVTQTVRADSLLVFRIGGGPKAPTSALPIGALASFVDPLKVTHIPVSPELMQAVLAVSHASTPDHVLSTNVAGFILIKEVDMARGTVTYLAPCPGPLPGRYLLVGSLRSAMD